MFLPFMSLAPVQPLPPPIGQAPGSENVLVLFIRPDDQKLENPRHDKKRSANPQACAPLVYISGRPDAARARQRTAGAPVST